jgi:hypothetical protein
MNNFFSNKIKEKSNRYFEVIDIYTYLFIQTRLAAFPIY